MPSNYRVMTQPQQKLHWTIGDLVARIQERCRRSVRWTARSRRHDERLQHLAALHPEYTTATVRDTVFYTGDLIALGAAVCVDAVLTAPFAHYLLVRFFHASVSSASIGRFALPAALIVAELGIGSAVHRHAAARRWLPATFWGAVSLLPIFAIPTLAAHTATVDVQNQALLLGSIGAQPGTASPMIAAMIAFSIFIHAFVVLGPHAEAWSYVWWHFKTGLRQLAKRIAVSRETTTGNQAADAYATYTDRRDEWARTYPDWPLDRPNWGGGCAEVLEKACGQPVIIREAASPPPPPPPDQAPPREPATANDAAPDADEQARQTHERRSRERDAAVEP